MWEALSLQAITSRLKNFPPCLLLQLLSKYFLPSVQRTALFLLCSSDAVWVPGTRLQLLSQPSLKCENLSLKAQEWNFFGVFQRLLQTTGLWLLQGCFATPWHNETSWEAAGEAEHGGKPGKVCTWKQFVFFRVTLPRICRKLDYICTYTSFNTGCQNEHSISSYPTLLVLYSLSDQPIDVITLCGKLSKHKYLRY